MIIHPNLVSIDEVSTFMKLQLSATFGCALLRLHSHRVSLSDHTFRRHNATLPLTVSWPIRPSRTRKPVPTLPGTTTACDRKRNYCAFRTGDTIIVRCT